VGRTFRRQAQKSAARRRGRAAWSRLRGAKQQRAPRRGSRAARGGEYVQPTVFAIVYTGLGQHDRAFDWLERAAAERDGWLAESIFYPTYDALRSHPRYAPLLQAMALR
jgi:hypothetical protein